MRIVRRTFDLSRLEAWWGVARPPTISINPLDADRDAEAISTLLERCRISQEGMAARLTVAGLCDECTPRPGRNVLASLARIDHVDPAGMVTLTVAGMAATRRFSIGWLVVVPAARRRGVATALVCHALAQARTAGAAVVHVETLGSWADADAFWRTLDCRSRPGG